MQLKIICLNLWQGGNLFDGILEFLSAEDADILLLQEVYNGTDPALPRKYRSVEVLRQELDYEFYDFAPAIIDIVPEGKIVSGNAVFSRFPLQAHEPVFFADPFGERDAFDPKHFPTTPRNLQHVTARLPNTELNLFNFQGVWDLNGDNYSPQRKKMSDAIIKATRGKQHVVLAGDTNARPTNKAMIAIEEHLHSVFGRELATTFNMRRKDNPGYATSVVDMIFTSTDITIADRRCPDVDISDHLPLVATLQLQ